MRRSPAGPDELPTSWVLITGEYPPQPGGVSHYTQQLARALVAHGDSVTVFAPPCAGAAGNDGDICVHRLPDAFGRRGRVALRDALARIPAPRAAIVQYVAQSFGMKGCNLPFAAWLRSLRGYPLWLMFHEVTVTVRPATPLKYRIQALATRAMATQALAAADATFVSTQRWEPILHRLSSRRRDVTLMPIPSSIAMSTAAGSRHEIRERFAVSNGATLYGHFGTYRDAAMRDALIAAVPSLLEHTIEAKMLFLGTGSGRFARALSDSVPSLRGRVFGSGALAAQDVANHLAACDVLLQPFEDGVTTRRSSIVAALALGIPVTTTSGTMTEPLWHESRAVALAPDGDIEALVESARLLALDPARRATMSQRARALYARTFALEHTVAALKRQAARERSAAS